jgi:hypothetical protein
MLLNDQRDPSSLRSVGMTQIGLFVSMGSASPLAHPLKGYRGPASFSASVPDSATAHLPVSAPLYDNGSGLPELKARH